MYSSPEFTVPTTAGSLVWPENRISIALRSRSIASPGAKEVVVKLALKNFGRSGSSVLYGGRLFRGVLNVNGRLRLTHCGRRGLSGFEVSFESKKVAFEIFITGLCNEKASNEYRRETQGTKPKVGKKCVE